VLDRPGPAFSWTPYAEDAVFAVFVTPTEPATPTGQRAAALKRCKKKFAHKRAKRRKCRRKANRLPV
jgi:hypothetical protein